MIKDYSKAYQRVISGLIEESVLSLEHSDLDYVTKVEQASKKVFQDLIDIHFELNDTTKEDIINQIKEMIVQSTDNISMFEGEGYKPWLEDVKANLSWRHRDIYYQYLLEEKKWSTGMIYRSIDNSTDIILDHMGNPKSNLIFTKKGLVIGDVQSGKTANYTALINKSLDVGYKLIIVLAGQQNDLRTQTQERLDKEVLGYETSQFSNTVTNGERIGVGKLNGYVANVDALTSRGNNGDFKKKNEIHLLDNSKPIIAVVKKNTSVLKNLYDYLMKPINLSPTTKKLDIPVLIIDDEVDQASINTKKPDDDPTRINGRIRDLINLCSKVSYVGYTATPYANVLIDANVNNDMYGKDLFPKDFIVVLPTPANYCGVTSFFGDGDDVDSDLINYIDDVDELVDFEIDDNVLKLKADDEVACLSTSLKNSIKDFIIASSVRRSRGEITHNGMMVHIAAYKRPANSLKELIDDYIIELKNEYRFYHDIEVDEYKKIWETRFKNISNKREKFDKWVYIEPEIIKVFELLKVKLLNGDSKDVVDYTESKQSQIIAIGGNKLSRGITLEGLMISYYLRDPKAYDTAMQMGRWFGYKDSYIDLCRIYSQPILISNFVHILDATKILREDISYMNDIKRTPEQFGMRLLTHPTLLPTAKNKMKSGTRLNISFSEQRQETIRFDLSKKIDNLKVINKFINSLDSDNSVIKENISEPIFKNVSSKYVLEMLENYNDYDDTFLSNVSRWYDYISTLNQDNELTKWTIVISNTITGVRDSITIGKYKINKARRKNLSGTKTADYVRAISKPSDFKFFFTNEDYRKKYSNGYKKDDAELKQLFNKSNALLAIYPIDITDKDNKELILEKNVIGLAIWFPSTTNKRASVNYIVNSVYTDDNMEGIYEDEE